MDIRSGLKNGIESKVGIVKAMGKVLVMVMIVVMVSNGNGKSNGNGSSNRNNNGMVMVREMLIVIVVFIVMLMLMLWYGIVNGEEREWGQEQLLQYNRMDRRFRCTMYL